MTDLVAITFIITVALLAGWVAFIVAMSGPGPFDK